MEFQQATEAGDLIEGAELSACTFSGANLHCVTIEASKALGADFEKATFSRTIGARQTSTRAFLHHSTFDSSNFYGVSFESRSLMGNSFRLADLRRCDLTDADLSDGDLSGSDVSDARFDGTDIRRVELQDFDVRAFPD